MKDESWKNQQTRHYIFVDSYICCMGHNATLYIIQEVYNFVTQPVPQWMTYWVNGCMNESFILFIVKPNTATVHLHRATLNLVKYHVPTYLPKLGLYMFMPVLHTWKSPQKWWWSSKPKSKSIRYGAMLNALNYYYPKLGKLALLK